MKEWFVKHRSRWALGVLFLFILSIATTSLVMAEPTEEEINAQKAANQQKIEQQKALRDVAKDKTNVEAAKLGEIQERLSVVQKAFDAINNEVLALELKIYKIGEDSKNAEKMLAERQDILAKRMRDIYKKGQISYIDVLLGASDFVDFATRLQVLQKVLTNDLNLINDVVSTQKQLVQMKKELEEIHERQEVLRKEAEVKKNEIQGEYDKQKAIRDQFLSEQMLQEKQLIELEQTDKKLELALRRAQNGGAGATGNFIRPTGGPITSPFGYRTHPVFGSTRFHSGVDIGAPYGQTIVASDGGEITYSGWMSGYGYTVIITHADGFSTLYAHQNQHPPVSDGQIVAQGERIGYVGSTGYSTGPHLHFEVRLHGKVQDPQGHVPF